MILYFLDCIDMPVAETYWISISGRAIFTSTTVLLGFYSPLGTLPSPETEIIRSICHLRQCTRYTPVEFFQQTAKIIVTVKKFRQVKEKYLQFLKKI